MVRVFRVWALVVVPFCVVFVVGSASAVSWLLFCVLGIWGREREREIEAEIAFEGFKSCTFGFV